MEKRTKDMVDCYAVKNPRNMQLARRSQFNTRNSIEKDTLNSMTAYDNDRLKFVGQSLVFNKGMGQAQNNTNDASFDGLESATVNLENFESSKADGTVQNDYEDVVKFD